MSRCDFTNTFLFGINLYYILSELRAFSERRFRYVMPALFAGVGSFNAKGRAMLSAAIIRLARKLLVRFKRRGRHDQLIYRICSVSSAKRSAKTYNSGYWLVVTHLTTNLPGRCLNRAERTGSLIVSRPLTTNILASTVSSIVVVGNRTRGT